MGKLPCHDRTRVSHASNKGDRHRRCAHEVRCIPSEAEIVAERTYGAALRSKQECASFPTPTRARPPNDVLSVDGGGLIHKGGTMQSPKCAKRETKEQ